MSSNTYQGEICPLCGQLIPPNTGFLPHNIPILVCNNCGQYLYSCPTCVHKAECGIRTYNGPKPLQVTKEVRIGPIIQRISILNPELEEEICPNCICGGRINCATLNRCDKYEFILKENTI